MIRRTRPGAGRPEHDKSAAAAAAEHMIITPDMVRYMAQNNYLSYCSYVNRGRWRPSNHLSVICGHLDLLVEGRIRNLIIITPPRHGKSMTVTEGFPSYCIGRNPDSRVIEISYGDDLAKIFGEKNRQKMEEYGPSLWGVKVDQRRADKSDWGVSGHDGGMLSAGIGGSITGRGADIMIIDDPIKNRQEADSEQYRERLWGEWQNTLRTRLHPGARTVIILTRWHEDDLAGRLIREYAEDWTVLRLPALSEGDGDPLGRPAGEALWPERYSKKSLLDTKRAIGSRAFEALYQGNPTASEGNILKRSWWQYYHMYPSDMGEHVSRLIQSWDFTFKNTDQSDYVVGQVWGKKGADSYLLDQVRDRMDLGESMRAMQAMTVKWPKATAKIVEDKANGPAIISTLRRQIPGIIPYNPEGNKKSRAYAVAPYIEAGNVHLPIPMYAKWIDVYLDELASFDAGAHDDQVDATTQALLYLYGKGPLARFVERPIGL